VVVLCSFGELQAKIKNRKSSNDVFFMIVFDLKNEGLKLLIKIDLGNY
tara:strand:- start:309 stop:452 length:144 start_codon:yes stop_codon:yes gene_type:complete